MLSLVHHYMGQGKVTTWFKAHVTVKHSLEIIGQSIAELKISRRISLEIIYWMEAKSRRMFHQETIRSHFQHCFPNHTIGIKDSMTASSAISRQFKLKCSHLFGSTSVSSNTRARTQYRRFDAILVRTSSSTDTRNILIRPENLPRHIVRH